MGQAQKRDQPTGPYLDHASFATSFFSEVMLDLIDTVQTHC